MTPDDPKDRPDEDSEPDEPLGPMTPDEETPLGDTPEHSDADDPALPTQSDQAPSG